MTRYPCEPKEQLTSPASHSLLWFIGLWLAGVIATALLVLPFRFLILLATHH